MAKKKVLVTGGGGFLGSYIVKQLLDKNYEVYSFSRSSYPEIEKMGATCIKGSLAKYEDVLKAVNGMDAVIHTAALAGIWGKWDDFYSTNFLGTKNIIEACQKANVKKLVYTSSPSVVFDGEDIKGDGEEISYAKKHWCHYPVTKMMAEELVLKANSERLITSSLRPHLIWGPKDPHFIPRLVERAKSGKLKQIGSGENLVDVIYVENAAKAHVDVLEKMDDNPEAVAGKSYFIGQSEPIKLWDFVNRLVESAGGPRVKRKIPLWLAYMVASMMEAVFGVFKIYKREPLLTRFLALQMAKSHYFSHKAAENNLKNKARLPIYIPAK